MRYRHFGHGRDHELGDPGHRLYRHVVWGGTWIAIGVAYLLQGPALFESHVILALGAALLAASGVAMIAIGRSTVAVVRGAVRIALAGWLYANLTHLWGWTFATTWPWALMAAGAAILARGLLERPAGGRGGMA